MRVIFGRKKALTSFAIRLFTWSDWSHCGVVINGTVYEATATKGVIQSSVQAFKARYKDNLETEIPHSGDYQQKLRDELGKKYDWGGIFKIVFRGDWSSRDKWFCSEYVAYASGIFNPKYTDRVTPQQIIKVSREL